MVNILDDLRFAVNNIRSGAAFVNDPVRASSLLAGVGETKSAEAIAADRAFESAARAEANRVRITSSGGSGRRGAQAIAAKEGELSTFDVMSVMPILSNQVGKSGSTYYEQLEAGGNIEARVGRRDGEPYLYMVDDKGTVREVLRVESNQVEGLKKQAAIINALNQSVKVEDDADADADADAGPTDEERTTSPNTTEILDTSLDLVPADDTPESIEATQNVEGAYQDVVEVAENTFGTGIDVETPGGQLISEEIGTAGPANEEEPEGEQIEVSVGSENIGAGLGGTTEQLESSFSDNEIRLQQELEAAQAALQAQEAEQKAQAESLAALQAQLDQATSAEAISAIFEEQVKAAQEQLSAEAGQASSAVAETPGTSAEVVINPGDALSSVPVAQQTYSSNTVTGGEKQQEASISVGASEDAAIDYYTKGVRGTILTTPGGLLTNPDDPNLRPRRGLIG